MWIVALFSSWKLLFILRKIIVQSYLTIIASNVSCLSKLMNLNLILLSFDTSYLVLSIICPFFSYRACYPSISSMLLSPRLYRNLQQLLISQCFHPWPWNDKSNFILPAFNWVCWKYRLTTIPQQLYIYSYKYLRPKFIKLLALAQRPSTLPSTS